MKIKQHKYRKYKLLSRSLYRLRLVRRLCRRSAAAFTILAIIMPLCGCAAFDAPLDSMLAPPKLTKTQTDIYNALTLNIGEQSELIYPKSGDFRSSFVLFNMDNEPTDEAVVFYREKSPDPDSANGLRMNLLDIKEGQWVSVADKAISGSDIESVSFYDFGDGINMMVCSSIMGQSENALNILAYSNGYVKELFKTTYSFMDIYDINDDGYDEMFFVNYDSARDTHVAYLLGQRQPEDDDPGGLLVLSSAMLSSDAVSIQKLTRQKLGESYFLLFLDYSKGDNAYGTQLLSCHSDNLLAVNLNIDTTRRYNSNIPLLYSTDIDGDGRVEIPVTAPMLGYELLTVPEQMLETDWIVINEENVPYSSIKYRTYVSTGYEYIFYFPVRWQGFVTVQKMENNTVNFVLYDINAFGDIMLSIRVSEAPPEEEEWKHYGDENSNVYVKTPNGDFPMAFTEDELNSSLYIVPKRSESK